MRTAILVRCFNIIENEVKNMDEENERKRDTALKHRRMAMEADYAKHYFNRITRNNQGDVR